MTGNLFSAQVRYGKNISRYLSSGQKLLCALLISIATALVYSFTPAIASLCLAILACIWSKMPIAVARRGLAPINLFFLLLWLTVPLSLSPEGALFSIDPVHYLKAGMLYALLITIKGNAIMLLFLALPASTPFAANLAALRRFGLSEKLITLLHLVVRHIHTFTDQWKRLHTAARLRGFSPGMNMRTLKTLVPLLGMLLINAMDQSKRTEQAMLLRGFNGVIPVFLPAETGSFPAGKAMLVLSLAFSIALVALDRYLR